MTVSVPIQANPAGVVNAIEAIRAAMRGVGDEGRALADIDFTKIMGTADILADLDRVQQSMRDLAQARGTTGTDARRLLGNTPGFDSLLGLEDTAGRAFPDEGPRRKFVQTVSRHALRGTRFDPANFQQYGPPEPPEQFGPPPPPAPPPPPPPPPRSSEPYGPPEAPPPGPQPTPGMDALDSGATKVGGALKSGLLGGMGFFLAQAGLSSITGAMGNAMGAGEAQNGAADNLMRRMGDLDTSFDELRENATLLSKGMQISSTDLLRYSAAFVQASGMTTKAALQSTRLAVGVAESFGADPGTMVHAMGHANPLGMDPGRFAELVGESAVRGSMGGRVEEVMGAISHWIETASRVGNTRGDVEANVGGFADLYTRMNASGKPMFSGANGVAIIDQLNGAITSGGGGGMAGQVEMMLALRNAGIEDPTDQAWQEAGGAFAPLPGGKGNNLSALMADLHKRFPKRKAFGIAGQTLTGINMRTFAALGDLGAEHIDLAHLNSVLKAHHTDINEVNPTALRDIIDVDGAKSMGDLQAKAKTYLAPGSAYKMTGDQKQAITSAGTVEALKAALIEGLARTGMPDDDNSRFLKAQADLQNGLAEFGRVLVNTMTPLNQHLADLLTDATPLFEWAANSMRPDVSDPTDGKANYGHKLRYVDDFKNEHYEEVPTGLQPIDVDANTGMLSKIGMAESGLGSNPAAHGDVFGLKGDNFAKNLRAIASTDPKMAEFIKGKSDADLMKLKNTDTPENYALQQQAAAYQLQQATRVATHKDQLGVYAAWHFWTRGNAIMDADPKTPMRALLADDQYKANPYLQNMNAGQWRSYETAKNHFNGPVPHGAYGPPIPPGGIHVTVTGETTHTVKTETGKVLSKHVVPLRQSGTPLPHGVAPKHAADHAAHPAARKKLVAQSYVDPATGQVIY